ncbi:unnamed protein product, partial [Scytosiphon promiscuus]
VVVVVFAVLLLLLSLAFSSKTRQRRSLGRYIYAIICSRPCCRVNVLTVLLWFLDLVSSFVVRDATQQYERWPYPKDGCLRGLLLSFLYSRIPQEVYSSRRLSSVSQKRPGPAVFLPFLSSPPLILTLCLWCYLRYCCLSFCPSP